MADEINRTPPKTQAALLEAMQERQVTIDGTSHPLEPGFFVVATQNPIEFEGVYPLPEAQLDRFLVRIRLGVPAPAAELEIYRKAVAGELADWDDRAGAAAEAPAGPRRRRRCSGSRRARCTWRPSSSATCARSPTRCAPRPRSSWRSARAPPWLSSKPRAPGRSWPVAISCRRTT